MTKRTLPMILAVLILCFFIPFQVQAAEENSVEYTVSITTDIEDKLTPEENTMAVGETFCVNVMISSKNAAVYNAYDLKIVYDAENLVFLPQNSATADPGRAQITDDEKGHIRIKGYGGDKDFSTPAATLVFETTAKGIADVSITNARIDIGDAAGGREAEECAKREHTAEAQIEGYKVIIVGKGVVMPNDVFVVMPNDDFAFTLEETELYTYNLTVTIDGEDMSDKVTYDESTETYTIPWKDEEGTQIINGKIMIIANRIPKKFKVTFKGEDIIGKHLAQYNQDYMFLLNREKGFWYTISVTIGGKKYSEFFVNEDIYIIPGAAITGDVVITAEKAEDDSDKVTVTFAGAGAKDGSGQKKTKLFVEYPFKIKQKKGYTYSVTVYVNGKKTAYDYDYELDTYYILDKNVTGNIVIVIGKIPTIEILEYITLEKQNMYLVVFNGHVNEGDVPKYDGRSMFWSDRYNAYTWLVTSSDTVKKVKSAAEKKITLNPGKPAANIDYSGDIDRNLRVDKEDTKLVWEMYEGKHSLDFMEMQKLLSADVYTDKKLNIRDVRAIANSIS